MNVMIESAQVARGAAGEWVPGSAGWAGHPASHGHASNASGSSARKGDQVCVWAEGEGTQTSGRGVGSAASVPGLTCPC